MSCIAPLQTPAAKSLPRIKATDAGLLLQRECACGSPTASLTGECPQCKSKRLLQTKLAIGASTDPLEREADRVADQVLAAPAHSVDSAARPLVQRYAGQATVDTDTAPDSVERVLAGSGTPLDAALRQDMERRFGYDFSRVRVHSGAAAQSARDVNAIAYTVGDNIVFDTGQFSPGTHAGRRLLAHELTHVVQQSGAERIHRGRTDPERGLSPGNMVQRRSAPYIKKVTVHLAPSQSADLEWEGTPPSSATGSDHFTVSTGKGYSDPGDPPGTCVRDCCADAMTQCAPPWNSADRVGACCTFYGNNFWTGTPEASHNGWNWWTPIQPAYSSRGIALHQHTTVTGRPIGHGCVRMDDANAKRIYDFSNGRRTNVTIDGRAAPVACDADRRCGATGGASGASGTGGASGAAADAERVAVDQASALNASEAVPGLEGQLT